MRRSGDIERPPHLEVLADMVEEMHLLGIRKKSRGFVKRNCIVLPAVPKCLGDIKEFGGAVITNSVVDIGVAPIIHRFFFERRGHHVPSDATTADMVHRCEYSGGVEGLGVGR